jgi:hypothetical protein
VNLPQDPDPQTDIETRGPLAVPYPLRLEEWCRCGHHYTCHRDDDEAYCVEGPECPCPGFHPLDEADE